MRVSTAVLLVFLGLSHAIQAAGDPYSAWAIKHFGSATSPAVEPSADPDGDGLDNLLEYALGTDPLTPSLPPTPVLVPVPWLTGDQSAYVITATIRTDDPDLVVFPQVSVDNASWLPFALERSDVSSGDSFFTVKVDESVPYRGVKQITWAARPTGTGIDPHFMRLTAIRQSASDASTAPQSTTPETRAARSVSALSSTPTIPGLFFTGQLSAAVGSELVSNTVVLRGLKGTVRVTAPSDITLIVNGIARGQSWLVKNGDTLALRAKAPNTPNQAPFTRVIQFGNGAAATWKIGSKRADALPATLTGTVSGYTPVNASVGSSGDANISIPITVSPGIGGMEPKLSISYSSQGGNGLLGLGFNLGGLSAISRTGPNLAIDSNRGSINFNENDRYALDGARLISVSGADGADGTTYEKELHDFSRIRSFGTAGKGPASWKVETKSGLTFTYGGDAQSQVKLGSRPDVMTWALTSVEDTVGNQMWFTYAQENNAQENKSFRIARIDYTCRGGIGNNSTQNHVDFNYENRPDTRTSYLLGTAIVSEKRLASVECKHAASTVRKYVFAYQQNSINDDSQLLNVQEEGSDGSKFAPTQFEWPPSQVSNYLTSSTSTGFPIYAGDPAYSEISTATEDQIILSITLLPITFSTTFTSPPRLARLGLLRSSPPASSQTMLSP